MTTIYDNAAKLTDHGYLVHQLCPHTPHSHGRTKCTSPGKVPTRTGWQKRTDPLSPTELRDLKTDQGIGVVTGHGLVVIDCDLRDDNHGAATLERLFAAHGSPSPVVTAHTGGGGAHYWFRTTVDRKNTAGRIAPLIDTRGTGGQVVVPPSVHAGSGKPYEWGDGTPPRLFDLPPFPLWLDDLMRANDSARGTAPPTRHAAGNGDDKLSTWEDVLTRFPFTEGRRNDSLNAIAFWIGQRAGSEDAERWRLKAIRLASAAGLLRDEIDTTFESGHAAGLQSPKSWARPRRPRQPPPSSRPPDPPPAPPASAEGGSGPPARRPGAEIAPTDEGAAVRLLLESPTSLLLSRDSHGKSTIRVAEENGIWEESIDQVLTLHNRATDRYRHGIESAQAAGTRGLSKQIDYCNRSSGARGGARAIESVGSALEALAAVEPAAREKLTVCSENDLDAQLHYLGAPNGVINLHNGGAPHGRQRPRMLNNDDDPGPLRPHGGPP